MSCAHSDPAVCVCGVSWRPGAATDLDMIKVARAAHAVGPSEWPPAVYTSTAAATLMPASASWFLGGLVGVWALSNGKSTVVLAAVNAGVSFNGKPPLWVSKSSVTVVRGDFSSGVRVACCPVGQGCSPVIVHNRDYADVLLASPGVNLAVTSTDVCGTWTDAVVISADGGFVCTGCQQQFKTIETINSHFRIKLIGSHYGPFLNGCVKNERAGIYTPDLSISHQS
jgi:hypothetical protein